MIRSPDAVKIGKFSHYSHTGARRLIYLCQMLSLSHLFHISSRMLASFLCGNDTYVPCSAHDHHLPKYTSASSRGLLTSFMSRGPFPFYSHTPPSSPHACTCFLFDIPTLSIQHLEEGISLLLLMMQVKSKQSLVHAIRRQDTCLPRMTPLPRFRLYQTGN